MKRISKWTAENVRGGSLTLDMISSGRSGEAVIGNSLNNSEKFVTKLKLLIKLLEMWFISAVVNKECAYCELWY